MFKRPFLKGCLLSRSLISLRAGPSSLMSGKKRNGKEAELLKLRMKKEVKPERMSEVVEYS